MSLGDSLSRSVGIEKAITLPVAVALSAAIMMFIKRNGLSEKYGLCRTRSKASSVLFYIPLSLLLTANLWYGVAFNMTAAETLFYALTMIFVGFLEEIIFRGLLFKAMEKDNLKVAVIVSALTFGMGHILNLFNGAELLDNILQVIYASATGFMLVMLYLRTESLIVPIAYHGIFNVLSVFFNEEAVTVKERIVSGMFVTVVSIAYGLYLMKSGTGEKNDNKTCK